MTIYILLAILNGIIIGINRAINGRLSIDVGPLHASFWNHLIGFISLSFLLMILNQDFILNINNNLPFFLYLGGFFGAAFVTINSYILPKIGAVKTIILTTFGQMVCGLIMDYKTWTINSILAQFFGIFLIMVGIYLSIKSQLKHKIDEV